MDRLTTSASERDPLPVQTMSRMNDQQIATHGVYASQVLENPAYQEAMKLLREQVVAAWKDCPVRDAEGQLLLLQLAKLTDKFEAILNGAVESGKLADHRLKIDELRNESPARKWVRRVAG